MLTYLTLDFISFPILPTVTSTNLRRNQTRQTGTKWSSADEKMLLLYKTSYEFTMHLMLNRQVLWSIYAAFVCALWSGLIVVNCISIIVMKATRHCLSTIVHMLLIDTPVKLSFPCTISQKFVLENKNYKLLQNTFCRVAESHNDNNIKTYHEYDDSNNHEKIMEWWYTWGH